MVVNNIADAMIMSRLFRALIVDEGVTVVTTSNRPPRDLYKDGLNREHFLPFITLIESELDVLALNGPVDYRLDRLGGIDTWHTPIGARPPRKCARRSIRLTDYPPEDAAHVPSAELDLGGGRLCTCPRASRACAVFSFKRLCGEPRGAARLPRDRAHLSHRDRRRHSVDGARDAQRGRALRHAGRRALREQRQASRHRRGRARRSLPHGRRPLRVRAHGQPPHGMQSADYMAQGHGVDAANS
jgi:cell division protein ZapE